ncbi:lytic transglycosylase domain-containing protein [Chromobacterium alticapitis]|uniref:Peptidoglycan N-acetylmuramoylhydrolase n=1 Tax=Chromobacterium alticapitis TaxID=2073169 RepID=A0A2S5DAZ3_9NEIS|nr:lytic transglycosylase domain-containing protein [Chromobacterium alticapitis]POZ60256.1 peptidoglycan N-acetylmuramoylhydrolase [Chromobacterium alticapitis]
MKIPTTTLRLASLAIAAATSLPAIAAPDDTLIAARDAFRGNDLAKLARLGDSLPDSYPLKDYPEYWTTWKALDKNDDAQVQRFLARTPDGLMTERIRNEWLKKLGMREDWTAFAQEWKKLQPEGRDEETACYGQLLQMRGEQKPENLDRFLDGKPAPDGCTRLIEGAYARGMLDQDWLWRRVRLLLAGNFLTQARQLAADTQLPLDNAALNKPASASPDSPGGQEAWLYEVSRKAKTDLDGAAAYLLRIEKDLSPDRAGFGWGQLALLSARKQLAGQAQQWFDKADPKQLTADQWEWWARSALRLEQWQQLDGIIRRMPPAVSGKPAWRYWQARTLKQLGKPGEATPLFSQASVGHSYYALLSLEELGNSLSASTNKTTPSDSDVAKMKADPAIRRSLALLSIAEIYTKPEFRTDAQREWRWAMRGRNDMELLAAAEIARKENFYDMAIYSAERTKEEHDFSLRYLTPYREITQKYARQLDIDDAWVYGLIRQESRFITMARSGVGASGLMQLMPATAKWAAKKIGLTHFAVNDIDTNVQLGTWYLRYVLDNLSSNAVMATAAYNAGPGRARNWQADRPLDGTIYAETIPFSETRDYVQKVMANAAYYSSTFGHANISLKNRMGIIPAR